MQIFRTLIISTLLITSIGCTEGDIRSVPLEKAPFMEFQVDYEGQTLTLSLDKKNDEQAALLSCQKIEDDLVDEYCEINKIDYDETVVWKKDGVVKQAKLLFPLSKDVPVDTQAREILSGYGLTLEDFNLTPYVRLEAAYHGAHAFVPLSLLSPEVLTVYFTTLKDKPFNSYTPPSGKSAPFFGYAVGQTLTEYDLRMLDCEKDPLSVNQSIHRCKIETALSETLRLTVIDKVIFHTSMFLFYKEERAQALTDSFFEQAGGREKLDELVLKDGNDFIFRTKPMNGNQAMLHVELKEDSSRRRTHFIYTTQDTVEQYIESL